MDVLNKNLVSMEIELTNEVQIDAAITNINSAITSAIEAV